MAGKSNAVYCGLQFYINEFIKKDFSDYWDCLDAYLELRVLLQERKEEMTPEAYTYFKRQLRGAKRGFKAIYNKCYKFKKIRLF